MTRPARPHLRRAGWTVFDQGLSSGSNVALALAVAHVSSSRAFGAFSLAYLLYTLALGLSRASCTDVILARYSASRSTDLDTAGGNALGLAAFVGLLVSAALAAAGAALGGESFAICLALGAFLPALLVQDALRFVAFAAGRPTLACANDGVFVLTQAATTLIAVLTGHTSAAWFVAAWGAAAVIAALSSSASLRVRPRPRHAIGWFKAELDLSGPFIGDFVVASGAPFVATAAIVGFVGVSGLGALRAAQVLFGPLTMLDVALAALLVPEGARLVARGSRRLVGMMVAPSLTFVGFAIGWALVVYVGPPAVGRMLLGNTWEAARPIIPFMALVVAANGAKLGATAGLRALRAAGTGLSVRLTLAPLVIGGGAVGAYLMGVRGAALGQALTSLLGAGVWWWCFIRRARGGGALRVRRQHHPRAAAGEAG